MNIRPSREMVADLTISTIPNLPLTIVDGVTVATGTYPSRGQLLALRRTGRSYR